MTGREWKRIQEYNRIADMADDFIVKFLDVYLDTPILYDEIRLTRNKLIDMYNPLKDLDCNSENDITAFCAGMLFLIMHGQDMGLRWISLAQGLQEILNGGEEHQDEENNLDEDN